MKRYPKGTWMKLSSPDMLRATMKRRGFSMERLARYAGCSKSMIGHLCSGHKTSCTPDLAIKISEALDVETELLFVPRVSTSRSDFVPTARTA
jgi:transcriptional regulator with XRE-family HTH domain